MSIEPYADALNDAMVDQIKTRFGFLCANVTDERHIDAEVERFEDGLKHLKEIRAKAGAAVMKVFGT